MITEDYVSSETAKLLKEKGMDKSCFKHYVQKNNNDGTSEAVTVCTLQKAMKWLRKVHNIHIELNWEKGNQLYSFQIWKPGKFQPEISSLDLWRIYKDDNYLGEWIYEEACEAAIKYCLENLI